MQSDHNPPRDSNHDMPDLKAYESLIDELATIGIPREYTQKLDYSLIVYLIHHHQESMLLKEQIVDLKNQCAQQQFDLRRIRMQRDTLRARYLREQDADPLDGYASQNRLRSLTDTFKKGS